MDYFDGLQLKMQKQEPFFLIRDRTNFHANTSIIVSNKGKTIIKCVGYLFFFLEFKYFLRMSLLA